MKKGSTWEAWSVFGLLIFMVLSWIASPTVVADTVQPTTTTTDDGFYHWPSYDPTIAYDYMDEYGPLDPPTKVLDDVANVAGTYIDGWWCFRYGPNKNPSVTSADWVPMLKRFNQDFNYITNVMRWPRDLRARNGYYSTIYLYGSGLSTDSASNTEKGGWQSATSYQGQSWPMVLGSYYPVHCYDPSYTGSDAEYQRGGLIHEGIHCILASMPGCKNSAWFQEGGNTWLQGTMGAQRSGDFSSIGWLSAGAMIAPFMPIECYSGWLQDGSFGGPSAEGVNRYNNDGIQLCTWRNLLGGTQYGECFPHVMEVTLGPKSVAWIWRHCSISGRVLQDMAETPGGLGDTQMRRLIQEYRVRQAFCDFGSWSHAFMQLLNDNWKVNIHPEYQPTWINCASWTATCYAKTTVSGRDLVPETRTLPGWSGANQIPLKVDAHASTAMVTFNPIGADMSCQLVYRDTSGVVHYGAPVSSGSCSIPLSHVMNNVVIAVVCNTDYVYQGEATRTAKYDYSLTLGDGVTGEANIYTQWYNYAPSSYPLTGSASDHGTISPSGNVSVQAGSSRHFTITPDSGYVVENVTVDGENIDKVTQYTFPNVHGDHRLAVTFALPSCGIWASSVGAGTLSPSGEVRATQGRDQTFTITPDDGFSVDDVTVDGNSVGAVTTYTFPDVESTHAIKAQFTASSSAVPAASYLLFSCVTNSLPTSGIARQWETYLPGGSHFNVINKPFVKVIDGVKWVENLYGKGDGYDLDSPPSSIRCSGASIVVAVQPIRTAQADAWQSIVDIFYDNLVLALNNQTGEIQVWCKGTLYQTNVTIPDHQKTVLSLVVQSNGSFKVYANGSMVYSQSATSSYRFINAGTSDDKRHITLGRNISDDGSTFNGYLGDVFVYKTALSDTERETLEAHLMAKFVNPGS